MNKHADREIREYRFPHRENADVYFSAYWACRLFLLLFCILGAATIATAFIRLEAFLLCFALSIISGCCALFAYLCERNVMLVMESESTFIYRTMFANVYEFRCDEIRKIKFGAGSIKIVCPTKNIYIDGSEVVSEKFRNKLTQVYRNLENVDLSELPDPDKKVDALKKKFYRRR